jgi:hypothetical protein
VNWVSLNKEWREHHRRIMILVEMMHRDEIPRIFRNDQLVDVVDVLPDLADYEETSSGQLP